MKIFSQLKSALLEKLGADPAFSAAHEGRIIYNTVSNKAKINDGVSWRDLGGGFVTIQKTVVNNGDTLKVSDQVICDSTGGAFGLNLPAIGEDGERIRILDAEKNFNIENVTITPNGADTIAGNATLEMDVSYGHIELISNGTDWEITALYSGGGATYGLADTTNAGLLSSYEFYGVDLATLSGSTTGILRFEKFGDTIVMSSDGPITHSSAANITINTGLPSNFRPTSAITNLQYQAGQTVTQATFEVGGGINFAYTNTSTGAQAAPRTTTTKAISGSWIVS